MIDLLLFLVAAVVIFYTGTKLTHSCDRLSQITPVGHLWLGAVLLSTVTSLPELSSTLAATTLSQSTSLAIGNVFGSNLVNITIIAVLWLVIALPRRYDSGDSRTAVGAIILSFVCALAILTSTWTVPIINMHPGTLLIFGLFVYGLTTFLNPMNDFASKESEPQTSKLPEKSKVRKTVIEIAVFSTLIIGAGILLSISCDRLAEKFHFGKTFAGTVLLGITTSLPEFVVTAQAMRAGFIAMASGNIFGSCCFNVMILAIADVVYRKGSIYSASGSLHLFQVFASIVLIILALIVYRSPISRPALKKANKFIAFSIIVLYLFSLWIIFLKG